MPGIARATDISSGHGCFPPQVADASKVSQDVFVETKGVMRKGDEFEPHCCGDSCHMGSSAEGSSTVFVNGGSVSMLGGRVSCENSDGKKLGNSVIITAAVRTFAGG